MRRTLLILTLLLMATLAQAERVDVTDSTTLRQAFSRARPGTRIVLAPGKYAPGVYARDLRGTPDAPITLEGADPKNKPLFEGGREALHLSGCAHLTLRNIAVRGQDGNGINIDDAGRFDTPAHHITLENVDAADIGPKGNHDAIKLSGLDDLVVRNCTIEGWAGEGIDMVGCHRVLIESCTLRGKSGFDQATGIQAKGGSSDVTIRNCTFLHAGQRAVNAGGSTDLNVFRPQGAKYEAKNITVERSRYVGGMAAVAFVGVDGATVRYNTIVRPDKWVFRILQETRLPDFVPSRKGVVERNLIVFHRDRSATPLNIGSNTQPDSFTFHDNYWFCDDHPTQSRPDLPTPERNGVYGPDPNVPTSANTAPSAPTTPAAKPYGADAP